MTRIVKLQENNITNALQKGERTQFYDYWTIYDFIFRKYCIYLKVTLIMKKISAIGKLLSKFALKPEQYAS